MGASIVSPLARLQQRGHVPHYTELSDAYVPSFYDAVNRTPEQDAAAIRLLTSMGALDVAPMLGLTPEVTA